MFHLGAEPTPPLQPDLEAGPIGTDGVEQPSLFARGGGSGPGRRHEGFPGWPGPRVVEIEVASSKQEPE
jgi:hypothetical protein